MRSAKVPPFVLGLMCAAGVWSTGAVSLADEVKPTGAPLVLSNIETEQPLPLIVVAPDGKSVTSVTVRLHWVSKPDVGAEEDAAHFDLDLPQDNPASAVFMARLWHASMASALAWQQPWQGARWKVLETPLTDGTGLDAALAVGMIATSARRPYPVKTVVIASLNPDGSLGPVSRLMDRVNAAAKAGITRAVIPSVQRFETDPSGQVVNVVRQGSDLGIECVPVDDLVAATETVMHDPLPDTNIDSTLPKYSNETASLVEDYAKREQTEAMNALKFAPKEADLPSYPPRVAAIWKSIYLDTEAAGEAFRAGQVYVAYQLFARANGRMNGANALAGQSRTSFDVKAALAEADNLHDHLHVLMTPPTIDKGDLKSALVVAEMDDWAYEINASIEGAQLVTKQAFSQRSDATEGERDRARESILFANAQCKYLLSKSEFYTRLLDHTAKGAPINVDANAAHLLPQLIPAQLATARGFTDGIRASDMRDGLLFDPRLVAYVNVLRQVKANWDSHQRKQQSLQDVVAPAPDPAKDNAAPAGPVQLNSKTPVTAVGFDPGDTYKPPHSVVVATTPARKVSDPALCLIWVNHDCEIATLDEKYLRLNGAMDAATHEWKVKDHAKLDALLQMAEIGARRGIAFAAKTEADPSVLALIYERAAQQRTRGTDAASLDSLRNFWRCALLGNMCWQLAHTHKAEPVDLSTLTGDAGQKSDKPDDKKKPDETKKDEGAKKTAETATNSTSTNTVVAVGPQGDATVTAKVVTPTTVAPKADPPAPPPEPPAPSPAVQTPSEPAASASNSASEASIPVVPVARKEDVEPTPSTNAAPVAIVPPPPASPAAANVVAQQAAPSAGPVVPVAAPDDLNIPVAPIAKAADLTPDTASPVTNAAPVVAAPPEIKHDNADGHANAFP